MREITSRRSCRTKLQSLSHHCCSHQVLMLDITVSFMITVRNKSRHPPTTCANSLRRTRVCWYSHWNVNGHQQWRIQGGGGGPYWLIFLSKAAFFCVKGIYFVVRICDKWGRSWYIVFRPPPFQNFFIRHWPPVPSIVTNCFTSAWDCTTHLYFQLYPSNNTNTKLVLSEEPGGT